MLKKTSPFQDGTVANCTVFCQLVAQCLCASANAHPRERPRPSFATVARSLLTSLSTRAVFPGDALEELWDKTGAAECPLILPEWSIHDRLRILTLAFETFGATRVAVGSKASMALVASGRSTNWNTTGLVLQSGHSHTICSAFYEGMEVAMPPGERSSRCATTCVVCAAYTINPHERGLAGCVHVEPSLHLRCPPLCCMVLQTTGQTVIATLLVVSCPRRRRTFLDSTTSASLRSSARACLSILGRCTGTELPAAVQQRPRCVNCSTET
jgi:hypothetical protein